MRLVHSFSTRPLGIGMYGVDALRRMAGNIWYYSLSVAYARRIGAEITLHTDTLGKTLLGHLPYDSISLTLDEMPPGIHPRFWAAGKMVALANEPTGAVHIDGDVFLKRHALLGTIENSEWDAVAQHYESSEWYEKELPAFAGSEAACKAVGLAPALNGAYNTGVLGFRDEALKERFLSGYMTVARSVTAMQGALLDTGTFLTPDVITEQRWFLQATKGKRVHLLLPGKDRHHDTATRIGFQHVITSAKFRSLDKCRETLHRVSPKIYESTRKLCLNILTE